MSDDMTEFSRLIFVARLPPNGMEEILEAKPAEREALAKRFDLLTLDTLKAELEIRPESKQSIIVTGRVTAALSQSCVVTLEPVASRLDIDIDVTFVEQAQHLDGAGEPFADELEEEIEVFSNGRIDLGELVSQQLGTHIDPYPRKPDAALPKVEFGVKAEKPHPFAGLADAMKNKDKTK